MKGRVRIAQVGCGYWGPNLMRNVAGNPKAELVAICDADPVALQRVAGKYPGVTQFTSLDEVLVQPSIDAVVIATPSRLHFEHVLAALQAGKHVLVEKPMTSSVEQAVELVINGKILDYRLAYSDKYSNNDSRFFSNSFIVGVLCSFGIFLSLLSID